MEKAKGKRRTFPAHKDVPVVVVDPRMNIYECGENIFASLFNFYAEQHWKLRKRNICERLELMFLYWFHSNGELTGEMFNSAPRSWLGDFFFRREVY